MATSEFSFKSSDAALGYLVLRCTLGMNIMMHGSARLLSGESKFVSGLLQTYQGSPLPHPLLLGFATALPWFEALVGLLVLIGFRTRIALAAGGFLMTVLTFGVGVRQNWEAAGIQLSYALVFAILLACIGANRYSLDTLLHRKAS